MAQVILLAPGEAYPADTDHIVLTEARRPSGELVVDVAGLVRQPGETEPAPISFGANFASLEIAVDGAQAYAATRGIPAIYVRREA